jgi:hypothetical protein
MTTRPYKKRHYTREQRADFASLWRHEVAQRQMIVDSNAAEARIDSTPFTAAERATAARAKARLASARAQLRKWEAQPAPVAARPSAAVSVATYCDTRVVVDTFSDVATRDAFRRMMRASMEAHDCSGWRVYIRPAFSADEPAAPWIGPEGSQPGPLWRSLSGVRVSGFMTQQQMHNVVREALRTAPLWAVSFEGDTKQWNGAQAFDA